MQDARRFLPKIEALYSRYAGTLTARKGLPNLWMDPLAAEELTSKWNPLRDELRKIDLLADLAVRPAIKVTPGTDYDGRGLVDMRQITDILGDIKYALDILKHPMTSAAPFSLEREGLFLAGQAFDAMRSISEIVKAATKSVVLVDGYIGETTLDVCSVKQPGVTLQILTYDGAKNRNSTNASMKAHADSFNKQHGGLSIRTSNVFHDRFIIIDDVDFYHVGTSIKDAGSRGFMFSRIEEPSVVAMFRAEFAKEWTSAGTFV